MLYLEEIPQKNPQKCGCFSEKVLSSGTRRETELQTTKDKEGEGNGTPLQYSCLENPMDEEPGRLQSMGSLRVRHD